MIIHHGGLSPRIHPSAFVAPNATICGDVEIGPECRIMHGAQVIAEGGSIRLGTRTIVLENAVLRATSLHSLRVGDNVLLGPHAHLVGCTLEDDVFIATGASVFHRAWVRRHSECRIRSTVHANSELPAKSIVPIGWVALGRPAEILPPDDHQAIWKIQSTLDFSLEAYGLPRSQASMEAITKNLAQAHALHEKDEILDSQGAVQDIDQGGEN